MLSVFSCAHWQGFRVDINEQFEALSFIIRFSSGFQFLSNLKKPLASIFYQLRLMSRLPISSPVNFVYSANIDFHVHIIQLMTCWYVNDKRPVVVKVRHNEPVVQLLIYLQKHSACELLIRTGLFFFLLFLLFLHLFTTCSHSPPQLFSLYSPNILSPPRVDLFSMTPVNSGIIWRSRAALAGPLGGSD